MLAGATSATVLACFSPCSLQSTSNKNWIPRISVFKNPQNPFAVSHKIQSLTIPSAFLPRFNPKASSSKSVRSAEYKEEPATKSKFFTSFNLPGCSNSLSLLATGYREKVFAIIGVKVYAAGLYAAQSVLNNMNAWRGQSAAEIEKNSSIFNALYQDHSEKSLQIILVRDIDGKTFWDALDEAISPRMKSPNSVDKSALLAFRNVFEGQPLKKGTCIFLTWVDPSKMLVSVSSDGIPSVIDATIESTSVTSALFDVFFGDSPVSPSLKASVADGLAAILK